MDRKCKSEQDPRILDSEFGLSREKFLLIIWHLFHIILTVFSLKFKYKLKKVSDWVYFFRKRNL